MKKDLVITKGKTFAQTVRWETAPYLFAAIAAINNVAPVQVTTSAAHNIPDGWRVAVVDAGGLTELNAANNPPKDVDFRQATLVDATKVQFNPLSSVAFEAYTTGGYLQWFTPHDMAGYTARMAVKNKPGGTVLLSLTTENGGIEIDDSAKTITLNISATDTAALDWKSGSYDLELVSPTGIVTALLNGSVTVNTEITT